MCSEAPVGRLTFLLSNDFANFQKNKIKWQQADTRSWVSILLMKMKVKVCAMVEEVAY